MNIKYSTACAIKGAILLLVLSFVALCWVCARENNLRASSTELEGQSKGDLHINRNAVAWNDSASLGTLALPANEKNGGINKLRAHSSQISFPIVELNGKRR